MLGVGIAVGWSVLIFPALTMAEAGPGPDFQMRLLAAAPIAVASGLLIAGGKYGFRSLERVTNAPRASRAAFIGAAVLGVIVGVYALMILFTWT